MLRKKRSILVSLSLVALASATFSPTRADSITETEPNDSVATANQLLGSNNDLIALGQIGTDTDVDVFRFSVTSPGSVQIDGFGSASGDGLTLDNVVLIGLNDQGTQGQIIGVDFGIGVRNGHLTLNNLADGTYYAAIGSGGNPNGTSTGTYQLEVQGFNGSVVAGFAPVPEASTTASFGLLLALGFGGVVFAARKKSLKA